MTPPSTPILDNFNRADAPTLGANWTVLSGYNNLKIESNKAACDVNTICGDYYNQDFGPDCEAYITALPTADAFPFGASEHLWIRHDAVNNTGYRIVVSHFSNPPSPSYHLIILDLYRVDIGSSTLLDESDPINVLGTTGYRFWISAIGDQINVYLSLTTSGDTWSAILNATDATYSLAGKLNIASLGSVSYRGAYLDDFGGGTLAAAPTADFSGTPLAGGKPLSVAFTDTSTGSPTSWLWDFGDGNTSTLQNPTHVYTADGVYTVALTATNDDGDDTETKVDYITVASPVADFSGTPTSGTVPLSVDFTDLSTNVPTSWFWDFGDGGSSTDQDPTYVYNYIGTYTVTLTATNGSGSDSETKIAYITVTAVVEYGAAVIENCDIDTGGLSVGLRVADVAIARDNRLESVTVDASAELRAKDNSYTTLVNNGTLQPLAGDRAVFDAIGYAARHTNDADDSATAIHHTLGTGADQAAAGDHAHAGMGTVTNIATGTGLTGGPITTTGTISDANTGVAAATYGDASNIPQIAVNAQGRITAASNIAISVFTPINVYNETQIADGVSLTYYLANYAAPSTIRVYIDGIRQPASDDAAPTDAVTFDVAPDLGAVLLFDYEMDLA